MIHMGVELSCDTFDYVRGDKSLLSIHMKYKNLVISMYQRIHKQHLAGVCKKSPPWIELISVSVTL